MTVKKIITYLLGIVIIGFLGYYFYSRIFVSNERRTVEYVYGKADTLFIPGVMKKTFSQKVFKGKVRVKKNGDALINDSASSAINSLSIAVHEINLDSVEVNFDFRYFGEMNLRVDTLKIVRVDTVRINSVIVNDVPFYQSFGFGLVAGLLAAIASVLL